MFSVPEIEINFKEKRLVQLKNEKNFLSDKFEQTHKLLDKEIAKVESDLESLRQLAVERVLYFRLR